MKDKKQLAVIIAFFVTAVAVLSAALVLGSKMAEEKEPNQLVTVRENETEETANDESDAETLSESESKVNVPADTETTDSGSESASDDTKNEESEAERKTEINNEDDGYHISVKLEYPSGAAERIAELSEALDELVRKNAPLRWKRIGTEPLPETDVGTESDETETEIETEPETDEVKEPTEVDKSDESDGAESDEARETEPETVYITDSGTGERVKLAHVYPYISLAYYDIETGGSVSYRSDEVRYSASLIKALYIYALEMEIDDFEKAKHDFDADGNALYDDDGAPLFEGEHPNYDENGKIKYLPGEEKYDLSEKWVFDPASMMEEGSGEIMPKEKGFTLTWGELIDYALLYSDNIAFAQLRARFGYSSFYKMISSLGIIGPNSGFMNLSADDCIKFLTALEDYFEKETPRALHMKDCMTRSKHLEMISANYKEGESAHKYGWDIDSFHDMAVIFDEHPYVVVIMTDYDDGGIGPTGFMRDVIEIIKEMHSLIHPASDIDAVAESASGE